LLLLFLPEFDKLTPAVSKGRNQDTIDAIKPMKIITKIGF